MWLFANACLQFDVPFLVVYRAVDGVGKPPSGKAQHGQQHDARHHFVAFGHWRACCSFFEPGDHGASQILLVHDTFNHHTGDVPCHHQQHHNGTQVVDISDQLDLSKAEPPRSNALLFITTQGDDAGDADHGRHHQQNVDGHAACGVVPHMAWRMAAGHLLEVINGLFRAKPKAGKT